MSTQLHVVHGELLSGALIKLGTSQSPKPPIMICVIGRLGRLLQMHGCDDNVVDGRYSGRLPACTARSGNKARFRAVPDPAHAPNNRCSNVFVVCRE